MKKKNIPYKNQSSMYDIASGLEGEKGLLLSPNRAIFSAVCSVLSLSDEQRKRELLGEEAYLRAQNLAEGNDRRSVAEILRKEHFPTTEEFEERHFFNNPTAGLAGMIVEEYALMHQN